MGINAREKEIPGEKVDYKKLYGELMLDVAQLSSRILTLDSVSQDGWTCRSVSGVEGCKITVDDGVLLIQDGQGPRGTLPSAWLIILQEKAGILRLEADDETGQRRPVDISTDPQGATADLQQIKDILQGMNYDEGVIESPFS